MYHAVSWPLCPGLLAGILLCLGVRCLVSGSAQNQTEAGPDQERESGVCVPELSAGQLSGGSFTTYAQLSTAAVTRRK